MNSTSHAAGETFGSYRCFPRKGGVLGILLYLLLLPGALLHAQSGGRVVSWGHLTDGCGNDVVAIAAGYFTSLVLNRDGTVTGCGRDYPEGETVFVPSDLTNAIAVSAYWGESQALRNNGTVVAWNQQGVKRNLPAGLKDVVAITGNSLALKADGTVVCWGGGETNLPLGLTNIVALAAGSGNFALKADGTVITWGNGWWSPEYTNGIADLTNVVAISAGWQEWMALKADGTVTGNGMYHPPGGLTDIELIAASSGNDHHLSTVMTRSGKVSAWGWNFYGGPTVPAGLGKVAALSAGGALNLALIGGGKPFLASPLVNRAATMGGRVHFRIEATGAWPLKYQWQFNGIDIPGATNSVLTLSDVQAGKAGAYAIKVSNSFGSVTSKPAFLAVIPILISIPPQDQITFAGGAATFSVAAQGSEPLHYQWSHNGKEIEGATNSVLSFENVQFSQAGAYSVVVSNSFGQVTSTEAILTVVPTLITAQPKDQVAFINGPAVFDVRTRASEPLSFQWKVEGNAIDGATNATLTLTNVQPAQAGDYSVAISNLFGVSVSQTARLSVVPVAVWGSYDQNGVPPDLTNVVTVVSGQSRPFALKRDGTWVTWGGGSPLPEGLTNAVAVTGGYSFWLALTEDGTVVPWGDNNYGQTNLPTGLSNVVAISAQYFHGLALKADGTVAAWGMEVAGSSKVPAGLSNVVSIAAGAYHNVVLKSDGSLVVWGDNQVGQRNVPFGIHDAVAIAAGWWHSLVLKADGTVIGFGLDDYGQATAPAGLSNVVAIACGNFHSLALKEDGTVVVWGSGGIYNPNLSQYGQAIVPPGLTQVTAIAGGDYFSLALEGDGPPPQRATPTDLKWDGTSFELSVPTQVGRIYRLEYKQSLQDDQWTALPLVAGNGRVRTFKDTTTNGAQRFYRVRHW